MKYFRDVVLYVVLTLTFIGTVSATEVSLNFSAARLLFRSIDSTNYDQVSNRVKLIGRRCLNMTGKDVKKVSSRRGSRFRTFYIPTVDGNQKGSMAFYQLSEKSLEKRQKSNRESNLLSMVQSGKKQVEAIANRINAQDEKGSKALQGQFQIGVGSAANELLIHMNELEALVQSKKYSKCSVKAQLIVGGGLI